MEILRGYNMTKFMTFVPKIRKNIEEWRIVEVSLTGKTKHNSAYIAKKLKEYFDGRDGVIFICNNSEIVVVAHMEKTASGQSLSEDIQGRMPKFSCNASAENLTADGLLKIQLRMQDIEKEEQGLPAISPLLSARYDRQESLIMVVDDDMFMRSLVSKTFQAKGKILELEDTDRLVETYLEELPDIVFLDIHLPGGSGIDALVEIISFDESAYVIILSADSVRENVLEAQKYGARGFIAKPFTAAKLMGCYNKCPTITTNKTA